MAAARYDLQLLILIVLNIYIIRLVSALMNVVQNVMVLMIQYAELCVPDVIRDINLKVLNLM